MYHVTCNVSNKIMLTKNDLEQIGEIVGEVVDEKITKRLKKELKPIRSDIKQLKKNSESLLRLIQHDYHQIQSHETRIVRIESHLDLLPIPSSS